MRPALNTTEGQLTALVVEVTNDHSLAPSQASCTPESMLLLLLVQSCPRKSRLECLASVAVLSCWRNSVNHNM